MHVLSRSLTALSLFVAPALAPMQAQAFGQAEFLASLQDYQSVCSRVLAAPMAFHSDPRGSFALQGTEELFTTPDLSVVDYSIDVPPTAGLAGRNYVLVSNQVGDLLEQSCSVADFGLQGSSVAEIDALAAAIPAIFGGTPGVAITGGARDFYGTPGYAFAVQGLFLDFPIMTLISIAEGELIFEHIHLSTVP